jgi:translation initiation factor 2 gamma subunit (eIF-2gamma)
MNIAQFEDSWIAKENAPAVFISAAHKENVDTLRQRVVEMLNP